MDGAQEIYRGNRAREVLENEMFIEAFETIRNEVISQWQQSPARDSEGREKLFQLLKIADKFKAILTTTLETGKLANLQLEQNRSMLAKAKDWLSDDY
jgi:hypothetical protein